jgi:hypothetical protein
LTNIKKQKEKKHAGKHYNNLKCFMKKSIVVIFNQLNIKSNKNDKDNLKKNKKIIWKNIVVINNVLRKKS